MKTLFEKMRDNRVKAEVQAGRKNMMPILNAAKFQRLAAMQSNRIGSMMVAENHLGGWYGYNGNAGGPL